MLLDAYRFFRFSASGATAVLPLLGAGSVCSQLEARRTLELLGVAAAFHAFAYVHNDVCDLAIDRTQPLRADYPLVRGAISPRAALTIALACVPTAFAIGRRDAAPGRLSLVGAFGLMAAYNRWGKACPFPPLTDLLQGAGWALLIAYGATADGEVPTRLTQLLLAYELLLILMVNGVHGALRDLENDQSCGAQTTAIMFGARQTAGGMQLPPALLAYALLLQLALLALPIYAASQNLPGHQGGARLATGLGVACSAALTSALLVRAAKGGVRAADLGMLHLILLLGAPVALLAPGLGRPLQVATLLAHTIPLLANGMTYDALGWLWGELPTQLGSPSR